MRDLERTRWPGAWRGQLVRERRSWRSPVAVGAVAGRAAVAVAKIDEADYRRGIDGDSLLLGDALQSAVDVREVVEGYVADEGAVDFVIAHAAVQPAQEEDELHAGGGDGGQGGEEVRGHGWSFGT